MNDELKWTTIDVTFCTPNPERLAAVLGVSCPCESPYLLVDVRGHTADCSEVGE